MKSIHKTFFLSLFMLISIAGISNQKNKDNSKTITFKVSGNCGMCKETIENALDVKGVKSAVWDEKSKIVKVEFVPEKIKEEKLHQLIAAVGYDTDKLMASDKAYNNLHGCCQYARAEKPIAEATPPKFENTPNQEVFSISVPEVSHLKAIFDTYFAIKDALVKTDGASASALAAKLVSDLNKIKLDSLTPTEKEAWTKVEKDVKFDAEHISENKDAGHQRDHFGSFSRNMMLLMKASKPAEKVYYQHCPMFNNGKGADWLSKESSIKNPYYGNKMLTCGKTVETIQ